MTFYLQLQLTSLDRSRGDSNVVLLGTGKEYISVMVMYVIIYGFVWIATGWLVKRDEIRINEAIREIQDEE